MLVLMDADCTEKNIDQVRKRIEDLGFKAHVIPGAGQTAVGVTGNAHPLDPRVFEVLPGVKQAIAVSKPYKLAGRDFKHGDTVIRLNRGKIRIGSKQFIVMAGPCAVENERQTVTIAKAVKKAGAHFLRGGAFKPRTSPYSFQGLGEEGLKILAAARDATGLPIVTEAVDPASLETVARYADMVQIGARNMQNFGLLKEAGRLRMPILLKRGLSATIDEWLMSAEYIMSEGNDQIVLCERGIRTFERATRNTLDLNAVPVLKRLSHLPVIVDPSHGTGLRHTVAPLAAAAAAVGAHGLMIEVHHDPKRALCDGPQAMIPPAFTKLVKDLRKIAKVMGKTL